MTHFRNTIIVGGLAVAAAIFGASGLIAAEPAFQPDNDGYKEVVVPFFRKHCAECHVGE